jgi:hypothetical protein
LTFGQGVPSESCGKYSNLSPCNILYFSRPLSISSNVILTYLKDQNRKRKLNWKKGFEPFSPRRPSATVPPGPISRANNPLPFPAPRSLPLGAHLSVPSIPPNSPAQRPRVTGDIDSGCCCAPSHHLEPAVAIGQLLPHLCTPLGHLVYSLTKASRRPATPIDRCQGRCATTMPTPSTQRQGLVQHLCFLLPCRHHWRASSRSRPSCLGARRHRALACPCAARGHDQHPPCPAHHRSASASHERTPTMPLYRRTELSHSPHVCVATHAAPSVLRLRRYIRPLPVAYCPPSAVRWSTGELSSPPCSASAAATAEIPSHHLSFLSRRSRSSAGP